MARGNPGGQQKTIPARDLLDYSTSPPQVTADIQTSGDITLNHPAWASYETVKDRLWGLEQ